MVIAPPKLEVRPVGIDDFDDIYPLLELFGNRKMTRAAWRDMLFAYPWWTGVERGFALYAEGVAVGFMGTIFSKRRIADRDEVYCNTSSWIVREEYRYASILLLKPILAMRDCTIVNWTPTDRAYEIFEKLGFRKLETYQVLLPPFAPRTSFFGATIASDARTIEATLSADDRILYDDLRLCTRVHHAVLRAGKRTCYVIATARRYKRVPFAEIQYVTDLDLFWKYRGAVHVAFARSLGAVGLAIDARFVAGRETGPTYLWPAKRLYRPIKNETQPSSIDGLFSETMMLQL